MTGIWGQVEVNRDESVECKVRWHIDCGSPDEHHNEVDPELDSGKRIFK